MPLSISLRSIGSSPAIFGGVAAVAAYALCTTTPALAQTPREILTAAAFRTSNKPQALALIGQALAASDRTLAARPGDREAALQRAVAIGYRAKLTRSRTDARASLDAFQRLAAQSPRDPEAQMVIAGWHLDAIEDLGGFVARTALGAKAQTGEAALDRAVALGGSRAFFPGLAAMMRIRKDEKDVARARTLAEAAASADTPTPLDALMKRSATALLPALRARDGKGAAAMARKLLPFGKIAD